MCTVWLQTEFGEKVKVVGGTQRLGDWSVERAMSMAWTDGDVWTAKVDLEAGETIAFKVRCC